MIQMLQSIDPARGDVVGEIAITPVQAIPQVVARSRAAQAGWAAMGLSARAQAIKSAAVQMEARAEEIGALISREMGKPLLEGIGEAKGCAAILVEFVKENAKALEQETLDDGKVQSQLRFDPLGVSVCITPWNFPVWMAQDVVIPSLVAGNTVIFKPSEKTPLSGDLWAKCISAVLPQDVLQIVHGDEEQGKALVVADVNLIAFVGSRAAGKHIMREAAGGLKRLVLELGGKDALIVLEDANLDAAVTFAASNCFRNAGQVCVSTERIFVHERVADEFETQLAKRATAMVQGDPADEATQIGPMVDAAQKAHVVSLVNDAIKDGARMLAGADAKGNFIRPTVLAGIRAPMRIMQEETFGPVACITRISSDEQAIQMANSTPFGLGGAVFGETSHAQRVASLLDTGMVGINKGCGGAAGSPWVGAKESGFGFLRGKAGHRQFTQIRVISIAK
ncbi:MAG: aldehyde dehydrogenase family protein [Phycisphaerales bacterium]|jgi:succinate-semialdehyde dehydrogenase/glutarate-semialdehyde dehydrogenase